MKNIIIILLIALSLPCFAQLEGQARIDSLETELPKAKQDTNHVKLLHSLGAAYLQIDISESEKYANKGLALGQKISFTKGIADIQRILARIEWQKGNSQKAVAYYLDNISLYQNIDAKDSEIRNLNRLSQSYSQLGKIDSALSISKRAVELSKEFNDEQLLLRSRFTLAHVYMGLSNLDTALITFDKALEIAKKLNEKLFIALILGDKGIVYDNMGKYDKAMNLYHQALKINEEIDYKHNILSNLINISSVLLDQEEFEKSNEYLDKAELIAFEIGEKRAIPVIYGNKGINFMKLNLYDSSKYYNEKAIKKDEKLNNSFGVARHKDNLATLYQEMQEYKKSEKLLKETLELNTEINNLSGVSSSSGRLGGLYLEMAQSDYQDNKGSELDFTNIQKGLLLNNGLEYSITAIEYAKKINADDMLLKWYENIHQIYNQLGKNDSAYKYFGLWNELKDSVFNVEKSKEIANLTAVRDNELKDKEIEIKNLELLRSRNERILLIVGLFFMIIVIIIIYRERKKSERLLINILPKVIAKRLKAKEHPISNYFEEASIIFIDIVGFTELVETSHPNDIVNELNNIFTIFDKIAQKHGLEKIKTIGDAYMAVSGIPIPNKFHAEIAAKMALDALSAMADYKTKDGKKINIRIGLDCGPVVAGVISEHKYSYDLWGDAVNMASRMESRGVPGQIQITKNFATALGSKFSFSERGSINVKGKGAVETYFLGE
jgi:class 3 adenylate cyclase/Tfp pilus assembly protein PilF